MKVKILYSIIIVLLSTTLSLIAQDFDTKRTEKFLRPEDRGEDLTPLPLPDLIARLSTADFKTLCKGVNHKDLKCVEMRKIAQVLGDRYLAKTLVLSSGDKAAIAKALDGYMELAKSEDLNDWEEASLQIYRFWHLAVPTLLKYVNHPDDVKSQLASQSLIEMRSEEIIITLINKANATSDKAKKRRYRNILRMMKYPYKINTPNRECMDEATTKEVYDRLVVPAIAKLEEDIRK